MKRSLVITSAVLVMSCITPVAMAAVPTPSSSPNPTITTATPSATTLPSPSAPTKGGHHGTDGNNGGNNKSANNSVAAARKAARDAARAAWQNALMQAQNGRDLAFADASATLSQALAAAGKDKTVRKAANDEFRVTAKAIIAAYKQAVAQANQTYKAALAAIPNK